METLVISIGFLSLIIMMTVLCAKLEGIIDAIRRRD